MAEEATDRGDNRIDRTADPSGVVTNPFDAALPKARVGTLQGEAARDREIAEVRAMMIMAKQFPRDERNAVDRILIDCQRPSLAEKAIYSYARGGTEILGPSIRLAESILRHWGNVQTGWRELDQRQGHSTIESYAWDLETNRRPNRVFQVSHWRQTKKGGYMLTDPRDIYENNANQAARRMRACMLELIPTDVVDAAIAQCESTLTARCEITPERIKSVVEKFGAFGVVKEQIEARIQRRIENMQPAQMIALGKIYNSLVEGMSNPENWFEKPAEPEPTPVHTAESTTAPVSNKEKLAAAVSSQSAASWPPIGTVKRQKRKEIDDSAADAYALGQEARAAGRADAVPDEVVRLGESYADAWRAGFARQDA